MADQEVAVIGLMRFSVVIAGARTGWWKDTKGRSLDEIARTILNPERLARRLRLAEEMPIASLACQTDPDFQLCILVSSQMPEPFRSRLMSLALRFPFIRVHNVDVQDDLKRVCASLIPNGKPCVTFRLDDDDAVGRHHVADLRAMATVGNEEKILASAHGLYMERRGPRLAFQRVEYVRNAFGIGFYSRIGKTIFDQGDHASFPGDRIAVNPRPDAWIRSLHADSDSDTRFRSKQLGWTVIPEKATVRLPEYQSINFAAVARDLLPFAPRSSWRNLLPLVNRLLRRALKRAT